MEWPEVAPELAGGKTSIDLGGRVRRCSVRWGGAPPAGATVWTEFQGAWAGDWLGAGASDTPRPMARSTILASSKSPIGCCTSPTSVRPIEVFDLG